MTDQKDKFAIIDLSDDEQRAVTGGTSLPYHETPDGPEANTTQEGPSTYIGSAYPIFFKG